MQQFSIDLQQDEIRNRASFQEYFVQDDWRLSNRITVNAGLRYTLNFPSTEQNDQAAVFDGGVKRVHVAKNGKVYKCKLTLSEDGKHLNVRGFIGVSLIGRTQTWVRQE